jgi:hypothetical protein
MAGVPPPEGYHSVVPYIVVDGVERLIAFLGDVLVAWSMGSVRSGATERSGTQRYGSATQS